MDHFKRGEANVLHLFHLLTMVQSGDVTLTEGDMDMITARTQGEPKLNREALECQPSIETSEAGKGMTRFRIDLALENRKRFIHKLCK